MISTLLHASQMPIFKQLEGGKSLSLGQTSLQSFFIFVLLKLVHFSTFAKQMYVHSQSLSKRCLMFASCYLKVRDLGRCVLPPTTTVMLGFATAFTGVNTTIESMNDK